MIGRYRSGTDRSKPGGELIEARKILILSQNEDLNEITPTPNK